MKRRSYEAKIIRNKDHVKQRGHEQRSREKPDVPIYRISLSKDKPIMIPSELSREMNST